MKWRIRSNQSDPTALSNRRMLPDHPVEWVLCILSALKLILPQIWSGMDLRPVTLASIALMGAWVVWIWRQSEEKPFRLSWVSALACVFAYIELNVVNLQSGMRQRILLTLLASLVAVIIVVVRYCRTRKEMRDSFAMSATYDPRAEICPTPTDQKDPMSFGEDIGADACENTRADAQSNTEASKPKRNRGSLGGSVLIAALLTGALAYTTLGRLNYGLDISQPTVHQVTVMDREHVHRRKSADHYYLTVQINGQTEELEVDSAFYNQTETGDTVTIKEHCGAFGWSYLIVGE